MSLFVRNHNKNDFKQFDSLNLAWVTKGRNLVLFHSDNSHKM